MEDEGLEIRRKHLKLDLFGDKEKNTKFYTHTEIKKGYERMLHGSQESV